VQVRGQAGEGAVVVAVQPEAVFQGGDEGLPLLPRPNGPVRIMENRPAICSPRGRENWFSAG
jgi:hypothetical protein